MAGRNIGIFGGTFDPIHKGHLKVAQLVLRKFKLDRLIFVPAGNPPHKNRPVASRKHRLKMVQMALRQRKHFMVSDYEIKKKRPAYSVETLEYFKKKFGGRRLFFIVGLDSLLEITTWHHPEEILSLCELLVVYRPLIQMKTTVAGYLQKLARRGDFENLISRIHFLKIKGLAISSTEIRAAIRRGRKEQWALLPVAVARYIRNNNIYN
jgi:nicotinate-nucleotide adenylyltransferase